MYLPAPHYFFVLDNCLIKIIAKKIPLWHNKNEMKLVSSNRRDPFLHAGFTNKILAIVVYEVRQR